MDKLAPAASACKLRSRYWLITDGNGRKEEIRGAGVIGAYPLIRPATEFEYCSCCPLSTPSGSMEGFLEFIVLDTKEIIEVRIGRFQLIAAV